MNKFARIILSNLLIFSLSIICSDNQPDIKLGYELSKNEFQVDLPMSIIRDEYKVLQDHWKIPKNRKQKTLWARFNHLFGYYQINENTSPLLFKTVKELGEKLKILSVSKRFNCDVYVYEGNKLDNFMSYLTGADYRVNAWASSKNSRSGFITFGSDVIENFNYGELRAVAAHELGHIKRNHIVKSYYLNIGLTLITGFAANLMLPFIVPVTMRYGLFGLPNYAANRISMNILQSYTLQVLARATMMPTAGLSRKFEKEADLMAFYATNDAESLISALDKLHTFYKKRHPIWHAIGEIIEHFDPFSYVMPIGSHPSLEQRAAYLQKVSKGDVSKNSLYYKILKQIESEKDTITTNEPVLVLGKDIQPKIAG